MSPRARAAVDAYVASRDDSERALVASYSQVECDDDVHAAGCCVASGTERGTALNGPTSPERHLAA